jgi:hypothetical protein
MILVGEPPSPVLRLLFVLALWAFSYLLWQIYEVVKYLVEHAKTRATQIRQERELDDKA